MSVGLVSFLQSRCILFLCFFRLDGGRFLQEFEQGNVIGVVSCDLQWVCSSEGVLEEALDLGII